MIDDQVSEARFGAMLRALADVRATAPTRGA